MVREILVAELVKEVLGPRGGIYETLTESPLGEYITGVLAPILDERMPEVDDEAEMPTEDTQTYEEETVEEDVNTPPLFHPALDPKNRPSTIGLSFVLESQGLPKIDVCLTWAKYTLKTKEEKSGRRVWQRQPRHTVFTINLDSNTTRWIDYQGRQVTDPSQAEISFHVIVRPSGNRHFVNLYLVNRTKPHEKFATASEHIFQPQIRISCPQGTKPTRGIRETPQREEEKKLEFIYRDKPVYARGHLCSAVWGDIDPENPFPLTPELGIGERYCEPPFKWLDGELLSGDQRKRFSSPHLRTEFVPIYSIPYPRLDWPKTYEKQPELQASALAEMWDRDNLRDALSPLSEEYEKWINKIEKQAASLPEHQSITARNLINQCKIVLGRIKMGIELLHNDDDARLAFCFANKAIDIQWMWSHKSRFIWHPFQIAFILMTLESIIDRQSRYRDICDLLWVPTGAGKTEAYLAIVALTISYRRRKALKKNQGEQTGAGVSIITRYTLRLLTIQQFRRTVSMITACEYLRVYGFLEKKLIGWRPEQCPIKGNFLWGSTPFTSGLWVGSAVTPNKLSDSWGRERIPGAISILKGQQGEGEPAQILNCPACDTVLSVPESGLQLGSRNIHFVVHVSDEGQLRQLVQKLAGTVFHGITLTRLVNVSSKNVYGFCTLSLEINSPNPIGWRIVEDFWNTIKAFLQKNGCSVELSSTRASRPGYFLRRYVGRSVKEYDFEIFCPNPECPLHRPWCGGAPTGWTHGKNAQNLGPAPDGVLIPIFPDGNRLIDVQEPFADRSNLHLSDRIPIPALTVDEQIYRRLPTIVIATVDKFARPPYEPQAATLFGNVDHHHPIYGYYRQYQPSAPSLNVDGHPSPAGSLKTRLYQRLPYPLDNPDLIIQDELHLIEGPLGSLVGIFECAIEYLCEEGRDYSLKYIASTATIRRAEEQTKAVFSRGLQLFPPHGLDADDRFFMTERELHALDDTSPGRLYLGICAPGRGPLTPIVRIYSRLLQTVWNMRNANAVDAFWTLTGYFNAIRELAGARALYRQDIPQRVDKISGGNSRQLSDERGLELSSRTSSTDLPAILDILKRPAPNSPDALFTTSMFGTGVDIPRIGLMIVNGQPKTTAAYIQSTGRVGRSKGALVVTFFRATRPRDLNHYEFFNGYHRQLHRFVEPATVHPFSPGVLERATGTLCVFILRNMRRQAIGWHKEDTASLMANNRTTAPEVLNLPLLIDLRAQAQPAFRRPLPTTVPNLVNSKLDAWQLTAKNNQNLRYVEYAITVVPKFPVVLGDYQHQHAKLSVVYENAPRSLRDLEETTGFQTR